MDHPRRRLVTTVGSTSRPKGGKKVDAGETVNAPGSGHLDLHGRYPPRQGLGSVWPPRVRLGADGLEVEQFAGVELGAAGQVPQRLEQFAH